MAHHARGLQPGHRSRLGISVLGMVEPTSTPAPDGSPPDGGEPSTVQELPRRRGPGRAVSLGLLITVCAGATIGMVAFLGGRIGAVPLAVGLAGAILPVPVLLAIFLWLDRYEPNPMWIMAVSFLWGAGVATSGSILVNTLAGDAIVRAGKPEALVAVLVAPVIEEALKAAFPLLLFLFHRRAFTGFIDGVVYCGLSATGFAMVENILYLGGLGYKPNAEQSVTAGAFFALALFIMRVPLTGFAHPLFTSMTGLGLGLAARSSRRAVRVLAPIAGLLAAMTLHALWNLMASLFQLNPYFLLYGYFAIFMPLFFAVVGLVLWVRSWEGRLAERVLPAYAAAGWFSPPEVVALGALGRRLSARAWARRVAGEAGKVAMRNYQVAATRLALVRDGLDRGLYRSGGPQPWWRRVSWPIAGRPHPQDEFRDALAEERRLLAEIDRCRTVFTGRDPLTPPAWWSSGTYHIEFPDGVVRSVAEPPAPVVPVPFPRADVGPRPG